MSGGGPDDVPRAEEHMEGGEPPVDLGRLSKPEAEAFRYIAEALGARFAGDRVRASDRDTDGEAGDEPRLPQPSGAWAPLPRKGSAIDPALEDPRLGALLDRIPVALLVVSEEQVVFMNRTALSQFGYGSAAVVDATGGFAALFETGGRHDGGLIAMVTSSGARFWARVTMAVVEWAGTQAMLMTVLPAPLSGRGGNAVHVDALHALLDANPDPVAVVSRAGLVEACNSAFRRLPPADGGIVRLGDRLDEHEARHVLDLLELSFGIAGGIAHSDRGVNVGGIEHIVTVGALPGGRLACVVLHTAGEGWPDPSREPLPPPALPVTGPPSRLAVEPSPGLPGLFGEEEPAPPQETRPEPARAGTPVPPPHPGEEADVSPAAAEARTGDEDPHGDPGAAGEPEEPGMARPEGRAADEPKPTGQPAGDDKSAAGPGTRLVLAASDGRTVDAATDEPPPAAETGARSDEPETSRPAGAVRSAGEAQNAASRSDAAAPSAEDAAPASRREMSREAAVETKRAGPPAAVPRAPEDPEPPTPASLPRPPVPSGGGDRRGGWPRRDVSALAEAVREVRQLVADAAVLIVTENDDGPDDGDSDAEAELLRLLILSVAARAPAGSVVVARREPGRYVVALSGDAKGPFEAVLSSERIASLARVAGAALHLSDRGRLVVDRMPATLPDNVIRLDAERDLAARSDRGG